MGATGYLTSSASLRLSQWGAAVGIPILAVQELGSIGAGGLLVAASLGPSVLAAPIVGAILDRTRRPRALIASSGLVTAAALALTAAVTPATIGLAVVALIVAGAVSPFYTGGFSSFVTEEIPDERKAYGYDALSYNISAVAGPALVALTVPLWSARGAMIALACTALLGTAATLATRLAPLARAVHGSVLATMAAGIRHILGHRPLALVTGSSTLTMFGHGALPIAAVALALERTDSPDGGAVIVAAFAAGGLLGAVVETLRPAPGRPPSVMLYGFLATGFLTVVATADLGLLWTAVFVGLSGIFTASSAAAMLLLRKQLSPPSLRSQVFTIGSGFRASASAAGAAVAGLAAGMGGVALLVGVGLCWAVSAALMLAYPRGAERLDLEPRPV